MDINLKSDDIDVYSEYAYFDSINNKVYFYDDIYKDTLRNHIYNNAIFKHVNIINGDSYNKLSKRKKKNLNFCMHILKNEYKKSIISKECSFKSTKLLKEIQKSKYNNVSPFLRLFSSIKSFEDVESKSTLPISVQYLMELSNIYDIEEIIDKTKLSFDEWLKISNQRALEISTYLDYKNDFTQLTQFEESMKKVLAKIPYYPLNIYGKILLERELGQDSKWNSAKKTIFEVLNNSNYIVRSFYDLESVQIAFIDYYFGNPMEDSIKEYIEKFRFHFLNYSNSKNINDYFEIEKIFEIIDLYSRLKGHYKKRFNRNLKILFKLSDNDIQKRRDFADKQDNNKASLNGSYICYNRQRAYNAFSDFLKDLK